MADAVGREIWTRVQAILEDEPLRVGCRVVASGLRSAQYNDSRGTLLRRQGQRWGVIFDGVRKPNALMPENLGVALPPRGASFLSRRRLEGKNTCITTG